MLAQRPPRRRRRLDRWSPLEKPLALRRSKPSHVGLIQKREKQARVRSDIVTTLGLSRPLPTCRVANVVSSGRLVSRTQSEPFEGLLVPLQQTDAQEGPASARASGALDLPRDECLAASVLRSARDAHVRSHALGLSLGGGYANAGSRPGSTRCGVAHFGHSGGPHRRRLRARPGWRTHHWSRKRPVASNTRDGRILSARWAIGSARGTVHTGYHQYLWHPSP